jgi:TM2 domain-containing membrane protein YozV
LFALNGKINFKNSILKIFMKKLLIIVFAFLLIIQSKEAFASDTVYKLKDNSLPKISSVVDLGEKETDVNVKSPLLAMGLSFIIPGAGQIYNGEYLKGALLFVSFVGLGILDFFVIEPAVKNNEKQKKQNSLLDVAALVNRVGLPVVWIYNWGSAYQSNDPVYLKKKKEEELKKENEKKTQTSNLFEVEFLSVRF